MDSGVKKRSRKDKLVPREVGEHHYETISLLQVDEDEPEHESEEPVPSTVLSSIPKQKSTEGTPDLQPQLEFAVKVEVESCDEDFSIEASTSNAVYSDDELSHASESELCYNIYKDDLLKCEVTHDNIRKEMKRLVKCDKNYADRVLEIELKNFFGRFSAPVAPINKHEVLIQKCLLDWKEWSGKSKFRVSIMSYKCYICDKSWWYLTPFREHIKKHESLKLRLELFSQDCNIIAYKETNFAVKHLKSSGRCPHCMKEEHVMTASSQYSCEGCKLNFTKCSLLLEHEGKCIRYHKKHYRNAIRADHDYYCDLCNVCYIVKDRYEQHFLLKHAVRNDEVILWPNQKECPSCKASYFTYKYHSCIVKHNKYKCQYCHKKFATLSLLNMHRTTQKETKCKICNQYMEYQCMEVQHMVVHANYYTMCFVCDICTDDSVVYPNKASFLTHKNKEHIQEKGIREFKSFFCMPIPKRCLMKTGVFMKELRVDLNNVSEREDENLDKAKTKKSHRRKDKEETMDQEIMKLINDINHDEICKNIQKLETIRKVLPVTDLDIIKAAVGYNKPAKNARITKIITLTKNDDKAENDSDEYSDDDSVDCATTRITDDIEAQLVETATEMAKKRKHSQSLLKPRAIDIEIKHNEIEIDDYVSKIAKQMAEKRKRVEAETAQKLTKFDSVKIKKEVDDTSSADGNIESTEVVVKKEDPVVLDAGVNIKEEIVDCDVEEQLDTFKIGENISRNETGESTSAIETGGNTDEIEAEIDQSEVIVKEEVVSDVEMESTELDKEFIKVFNGSGDYSFEEVKMEIESDEEYEDDIISLSADINLMAKLEPEVLIHHKTPNFSYSKSTILICEDFTPYQCTLCDKKHNRLKDYVKHLTSHGLPKSGCPVCATVIVDNITKIKINLTGLTTHVATHIKSSYIKLRVLETESAVMSSKQDGIYQCKTCNKTVNYKDFFIHWELHWNNRLINQEPKEATVNMDEDFGHSSTHIRELISRLLAPRLKNDARACTVCQKSFDRWNDYKRHLIEHLLDDAYSRKIKFCGFRCQICKEVLKTPSEYKHHLRLHGGLMVYRCALCDKTFSDSSNFVKHKKVHYNTAISCSVCKRKFMSVTSLEKHMQLHEQQGAVKCSKCLMEFECPGQMSRHMKRYHLKKERFMCRCCKTGFSALKDKWDHMWLVHRERPVEADCPYCEMKFRKTSALKRHVRSEHEFICRGGAAGTTETIVVTSGPHPGMSFRFTRDDSDIDDDALILE